MIELCKIGMTQATAALATLIGKEANFAAPRLCTLDDAVSDDAESLQICGGEQATAVQLRITGSWGGTMLILLGEVEARLMLGLLLGEAPAHGEPLSELQRSALMEIGNIMGSAFLNAVAAAIKVPMLPSVPTLLSGPPATMLRGAAQDQEDHPVAIEAAFSITGTPCSGRFFLIPGRIAAGSGATAGR